MVVGITGGVGTGKSTVLDYLKTKYNAAVILADDVARDLMMPGNAAYDEVVNYFGRDILTEDAGSEIDRKKLAGIVFADKNKLSVLNNMTHPLVKKRIQELTAFYKQAGFDLIVIEAALLIQAGYLDIIDQLWVIHTDYEVRVERLEKSRGYTREKTDSIISNQMKDDEMEHFADFVIDNSGSIQSAAHQIDRYLSSIYERNNNNR